MTILASPRDRAALLGGDQRFFDALVTADTDRLSDLLDDDFILVAVNDGAVVTRAALLEAVSSGAVRFPAVRAFPDEAVVRCVGDIGIVVGRTAMDFTGTDDGVAFSASSRYTHVFARNPGTDLWRLVSAQGTALTSRA